MKKSIIVLGVTILCLFISCTSKKSKQNDNRFYVSGQIDNMPDSTLIYLILDDLSYIPHITDSCYTISGHFLLSDTSSLSKRYQVASKNKSKTILSGDDFNSYINKSFYITPMDTTFIVGKLIPEIVNEDSITISGNEIQKLYKDYIDSYNVGLNVTIDGSINPDTITDPFLKLMYNQAQQNTKRKNKADSILLNYTNNPIFLELLEEKFYLTSSHEFPIDSLESLMQKANGTALQDPRYPQIKKRLQYIKNCQIGKQATNISFCDTNGSVYSLDQYKGKLILLNFTSAHCYGCTILREQLNKFLPTVKDDRLVCISMYDDKEIEDWREMERYSDNWITGTIINQKEDLVSDAFTKYNIYSYPTPILIDQDFNILIINDYTQITEQICKILGKEYDPTINSCETTNPLITAFRESYKQ